MSNETASLSKRLQTAWPVGVLVLLSVPIIFYNLGSYGLVDADEGIYHDIARNMVRSGNWFHTEFTGEHRVYDTFMNAPLQYWARAILIILFGDNYWTMRIIAAAFGLFAVLMTYRLASYVAGREAGLLAGFIQLTSFHFIYCHSARNGELDSIVPFLFTASAYFFLRAIETGRSFVAHHVCFMLMVNIKLPVIMMPFLAELIFFAVTRSARSRFRGWVITGAVLLPFALVWHIGQAIALGDEFIATMSKMAAQASGTLPAVSSRYTGIFGNVAFYVSTVVFGAFPWVLVYPVALVGVLAKPVSEVDGRCWRLIALYAAAVFAFYVGVAKHFPWYIGPMYPFLSAFAAVWLVRLRNGNPRVFAILAVALILAFFVWVRVGVVSVNPFDGSALNRPVDYGWRELAGVDPLIGVPLSVVAIAMGLFAARRSLGRQFVKRTATGLALVLGLTATVRVLYPLKFTNHVSELELVSRELHAAKAAGQPIPYPVLLYDAGKPQVRFLFHYDFTIVHRPARERGPGEPKFVLLPKEPMSAPANTAPPVSGITLNESVSSSDE